MSPAIEVDGLHKAFGPIAALAGVDLTVADGSILGLLGPNGAGKTTLVRILATLLTPDRGRTRIGGYDVARHPVAVRRLIGLAGQHAAVDEALTGRENLHLVGRLYRLSGREARSRAGDVLDRLSLADAADRPVRTYSGGMRRRLDVGASLVGRPRVLLLDEPSTGLDPASRLALWALVRGLADHGTTVLLTTQQLDEADHLADDIAVVDHGVVIDHGTPAALKARLGDHTVAVTVTDHADLDHAARVLARLSSTAPEPDPDTGMVTFAVPAGSGRLAAAARLLDDAGIDLSDVTVRQPSLEDVFLALTGTAPRPSTEAIGP
jgi:ABC-2 type transport system ATP-binding protein